MGKKTKAQQMIENLENRKARLLEAIRQDSAAMDLLDSIIAELKAEEGKPRGTMLKSNKNLKPMEGGKTE